MAAPTAHGRLRRLADFRPDHGRVLSAFFDLDPTQFGTGEARASQITSVCDQADRLVEQRRSELSHDELVALREDVQRIRDSFNPQRMGEGGARGLAVFACGPADLFEVVRLAYPIASRVTIGDSPEVSPLLAAGERERWCVTLVSSREGRVFLGNEDGMEELDDLRDEIHGRGEDSASADRHHHLTRVADALLGLLRARPFDRLVIGGPDPVDDEFEAVLHPYLAERLAGHVSVDLSAATPASVLEAATPVFEARRREHQHAALERLKAHLGRNDGRGAAGRDDVRDALEQRRVETLLLDARADAVEDLVEQAVDQSAEVLVLDDEAPDLQPHGGVAAVLRF
jgi:hypothetical protein